MPRALAAGPVTRAAFGRRAAVLATVRLGARGARGDLLGRIAGALDGGGGEAAGPAAPCQLLGADITFVEADEAAGATCRDGAVQDIVLLLEHHGMNAIRLRTFVDPRAADGYNQQNGTAEVAHTIAFARRVKAAGMRFLLDFH
jgi:hypothetical protein